MPDRRSLILAAGLLLSLWPDGALASEISFPLTWNGRGYILRHHPSDSVFFFDGGLEATADLVAWDADAVDGAFYIGAGFEVGMGRQDGGLVVFDPNDAHYSIRGGVRFEVSGILATVEMLHDCFHDVDRHDGVSPIWNVARLGAGSRGSLPRHRRERWSTAARSGPLFDLDWRAELWLFPRLDLYEWVQHDHDLSIACGGGIDLALFHWGRNALELRPDALLFLETDGDWSRRVGALVYLTRYGSGAAAALFAGRLWDNQPIRPAGSRWVFGFEFLL
ncbi:MAG: hypothetical protein PHQ19_06005 [Candidatus Krumholzibacteria bacterium]|nr:hypothetical protein [Candidatus Krumholzibacteria bacterium]